MELKEIQLTSEQVFDGVLLKVYRDTVRLPDGGQSIREVVRHPGAVVIVPVDGEGNIWLVRQFRYPYGEPLLEVPAGKLEPGEEPFPAAQRELEEEIGARAGQWIPMGEAFPTPGFCDERQHVYLARDLTFGQAHPDADEFLERVSMPMAEAVAMAVDGRIRDCKTAAAILRVHLMMEGERHG